MDFNKQTAGGQDRDIERSLDPIRDYAIRLGDDALVLGHRLSEWTSRGPFLEEDLALANTALDYLGRARMFYGYAAERSGDGLTEDDFAYTRDERDFMNFLILELPRGDFAFTLCRQFLVDVYQQHMLHYLGKSDDQVLSAIALKAQKETAYHLRRSQQWMLRLGDGTEESHQRLQKALDDLWGYTTEMFEPDSLETSLAKDGVAVDTAALKAVWHQQVSQIFGSAGIEVPESSWSVRGGRQGYHTENLGHLLTEMQFVNRSMPGLAW